MARKIIYKTKQMDELLEYMISQKGHHVTVIDIAKFFEERNVKVGTTTIYRNLDKLIEQDLVAKYTIDQTSGACFEYIGDEHKEISEHTCYHGRCDECGRVIHMDCDEIKELGEHFLKHHGFELDYHRTVFYGVCEKCRKERENSLLTK